MSELNSPSCWRPSPDRIATAQMRRFAEHLGWWVASDELSPRDAYAALHRWSLEHPGLFWRAVWAHCRLRGELGDRDMVLGQPIWDRPFFPDGLLNYAENLLQPDRLADPEFARSVAVIAVDEHGHEQFVTRQELHDQVARLTAYMRRVGIGRGDRVAAVLPNRIEAVVGLLAASAVGAIWTCCSPDFGDDALVDRFGQTEPVLLITTTAVHYNGKHLELEPRMQRLVERLPTVTHRLVVGEWSPSDGSWPGVVASWETILSATEPVPEWRCERLPFNHPLAILYSSGTTGAPKCIMHGAGGTLLQHAKEQSLHVDLHAGNHLFYYTTTGWMMWNWLVSALALDGAIVLYDGSPLSPDPGVLWRMADRYRVTHFGASARYYAALEKSGFRPRENVELGALKSLLSTGSPLMPEQFEWLYASVKQDMHLASISGGTDIVSCFVLGNPTLEVHAGEIQCKGLGMDVQIVDATGRAQVGVAGELVCKNAFPSMPIGFWNDAEKRKYRATYFERYPDAWWHGDWSMETQRGGLLIYGRSDATLNPGGVRIGTAELYRQIEGFPEVVEAIATAWRFEGDEKIVLFVRLRDGCEWTEALEQAMRDRLRRNCSPRHVPTWIVSVVDLPRTISGKLSEIAVRNAISGQEIGNVGALANPQALDFFRRWQPSGQLP